MRFESNIYGDPGADTILIQLADAGFAKRAEEPAPVDKEIAYIRELAAGKHFCLKVFSVNDWNQDLAPWEAPDVFRTAGRRSADAPHDFGSGAEETLESLLEATAADAAAGKQIFLGGYSLAGLFALWAGCRTDRFGGIAAASPSVWYPGFTEYMRANPMRAEAVYLSLGDREERTRNRVMARVGDEVRAEHELLRGSGTRCILEWNEGNHFKDVELRMAKAFAWLMNEAGNTLMAEGSPADRQKTEGAARERLIEELLEKPYWVVDVLPERVPVNSAGQYFAVEQYYRQPERIAVLHRKFADILLKLNCYYDMAAGSGGAAEESWIWEQRPAPEKLETLIMQDGQPGSVLILIESEETLIVIDRDDLYMTVYDPPGHLLEKLRTLAAAEGLFVWQ